MRQAAKTLSPLSNAAEWLADQCQQTLPVDLWLLNELFRGWAEPRNGIQDNEARNRLRRQICSQARDQFTNGEQLVAAVRPGARYCLFQLVYPAGDEANGQSECVGLDHWAWLGPIALEALRIDPARMALPVAHLVASETARREGPASSHITPPGTLDRMFGSGVGELLQRLEAAREPVTADDQAVINQVLAAGRDPA